MKLPSKWNRLIDGRIFTGNAVYYSNGTYYNIAYDQLDEVSNEYPNPETVEVLGASILCTEENEQPWQVCGYKERDDGVIESPNGFKLYPTGLLTTKDDLVFLDQLNLPSYNDFRDKIFYRGDNAILAYIEGKLDDDSDVPENEFE